MNTKQAQLSAKCRSALTRHSAPGAAKKAPEGKAEKKQAR
jgi:hypothetical protein